MTCPNCGTPFDYGVTCPSCNVDIILFTGTIKMSDALYNRGLAKIKVADLSGAIEALSKSIAINKNNTQARNLLGLVQYEIGYLGEALKNWVISCGLQKEGNPATKYIEAIQKNARALERLNDAIRIYNQALSDILQKSDDMAVIKLKQAIDINPNFVDALNLLTFCYLIQKDKTRAGATAERVLAIDANNIIALSYYDEINRGRTTLSKGARKRNAATPAAPATNGPPIGPYKKVTLHERRNVNFHIEGILCFVLGVVCALGVMFVLVNPTIARGQAGQVDDMQSRLNQAERAYSALLEEKEEEIAAMQEMILQYSGSADYWATQYDNLDRSVSVLSAFELLREDRLREAVDAIAGVTTDGLRPDIAERFYEVVSVAYPQLARQYYTEGVQAYNASDFEKARVDFERAYRYVSQIEDTTTLYSDIIYYLAWTFSQDIDIDLAIHYFERLFEEFPGHRYTNAARNRFVAIGGE